MTHLDNRGLFPRIGRELWDGIANDLGGNVVQPRDPITAPPPPPRRAPTPNQSVRWDSTTRMIYYWDGLAGDWGTPIPSEQMTEQNWIDATHADEVSGPYGRPLIEEVMGLTVMGLTGMPMQPTRFRSKWHFHIAQLQDKRQARIEAWHGAHGSSQLMQAWSPIRTWWWRRQTRKLLRDFQTGTPVKINDESICWNGRSGEIVDSPEGRQSMVGFTDMVYVKLHGGCVGARDYVIMMSVYRLVRMDHTAAEFERRRWVELIDRKEWGERTFASERDARRRAEPTPEAAPKKLDELPEPVIEPVKHKHGRRLIV